MESNPNPNPRGVCIKAMKFTVMDGAEGRCKIEKVGGAPFPATST